MVGLSLSRQLINSATLITCHRGLLRLAVGRSLLQAPAFCGTTQPATNHVES